MAIDFYYGSGSQFAWRVWLALEHKAAPYVAHRLRFDNGDLRTPAYLAISPRGKVPAIVDEGFALFESSAIVAYLEDRFPGAPLLPGDARARAVARRIVGEADSYLNPALESVLDLTLFRREPAPPAEVASAMEALGAELARFEGYLQGDTFTGALSLADFAVYPMVRFVTRIHERQPQHRADALLTPRLRAFSRRVEALPYYDRTVPPHWRE